MSVYGSGLYGDNTYGNRGIYMSYNPRRNELFISKDSSITYILSEFGLSAVSSDIRDIAYRYDELIIHSPAAIAQDDVDIKTNILDLGSNGSKRILGVEAVIISPDDVFISIDYRTDRGSVFTTTPEIAFDKERGFAKFDIKGVEFIINFRVEDYTSLRLSKAVLKYSYLDRRRRGG